MLIRIILMCCMPASLCGCDILRLGDDRHVDTQSLLDSNRKMWDSQMASNYQFYFQWSCYCTMDFVAEVNITVRENRIRVAAFVESDVPIPLNAAIERYKGNGWAVRSTPVGN